MNMNFVCAMFFPKISKWPKGYNIKLKGRSLEMFDLGQEKHCTVKPVYNDHPWDH
jgi:hypothetical protein